MCNQERLRFILLLLFFNMGKASVCLNMAANTVERDGC